MFRRKKFSARSTSMFLMNAKRMTIETRFSFSTVVATWFYIGKFPIMPGTIASICTYPIYYFMIISSTSYSEISLSFFIVTAILWLLGLYSVSVFQKETHSFDHQMIVIDEIVGQLLTFAISYEFLDNISRFLYFEFEAVSMRTMTLSFIIGVCAFRFFDIAKPFFIKNIDKNYKGAFGVMLDDIVAGIFAGGSIYICHIVLDKLRYL
ncbi:phosphatidylglycerophosphatase A [Candidatus Lariskella endosymbiont of Epinotia ramella]|uniref:phosphatidylglycerophosphatase A family protein n=1 Tax=Candidatus Lariskella endosymbiont of Epinotia ramella TaxID=3066224 RepID=UPI0030CD8FAF